MIEGGAFGRWGIFAAFHAVVLTTMMCAAGTAAAAPASCTVASLSALSVPRVSISSATARSGSALAPDYCDVLGTVATNGEGAPGGAARFELKLPVHWNGKFVFWGVGGLGGNLYPSVTRADIIAATVKGYATAITDTGHQAGGTDASWAIVKPGVPDEAKLADYYFRAVHDVTIATKLLVQGYFDKKAIDRSYFDGCSNGGRQALIEAMRYPDDYDGIIAGAPFMDLRAILAGSAMYQRLLSRTAFIPASLLAAIDQAVYQNCDSADGVKDGLIQYPGRCTFDPKTLVCKGAQKANCLTDEQAATLSTYLSAVRNEAGQVVYTGGSMTDLHGGGMDTWLVGASMPADFGANEPWGDLTQGKSPLSWQFSDQVVKYIVERDPAFDIRNLKTSSAGAVSPSTLALFDERTKAGNADRAAALEQFIASGKKLLIYHGFSDPALSPYRTMAFYEEAASTVPGKYQQLRDNVRLFMVPGMQHCAMGPGPNVFETLSALEAWVEQGKAPDSILASHYRNNSPKQPVDRTMPLCPFPATAKYGGSGDVNDAANWSCPASNQDLLDAGPAGKRAGLR